MKLSTKIAYNTIIQFASKIISIFLGLSAIAIITRYLGPEIYGEYTIIITFISFFAIIADMGITLITVQLISRPGAEERNILSNLLGLRLFSALFFLGLAPLLVIFFPYSAEVKFGVLITSLSFLCIALNQVFVGLFQKNLRMDKVSIAEVTSRLVLLAGIILVYHLDLGLMGVLYVTITSNVVNFLLHYIFSRSFQRISLKFDFKYWKIIIKKSWPLALTITLNLVYLKSDTLILSIMKSESEVGLYGAAYKVIDVIITIPFMFAGIMLPILTERWARGKKQDFKNILQKSFDLMAILSIPLIFGAYFLSEEIMTLVAGHEFRESGAVLRILIAAATLIFIGNVFSHAIIAINRVKELFKYYFFTALTALVGYFVFIPKYSYFGAAYVTIYSELAIAIAFVYLIYKHCHFLPKLNKAFASIAASFLMMLFILFLKSRGLDNLFVIISVSSALYFGILYLLQGIEKKDIMVLLNK